MSLKDNKQTNIELFLRAITENGINFASGVPDSLLADLSSSFDAIQEFEHLIAANEGLALSLGVGYYLGTKKRPLVYLQNSGLGNLINPYLSLAHKEVFDFPVLFLVGWRGEDPSSDEPQHRAQGSKTTYLLDLLDLPQLHLFEDSNIYTETSNFLNDLDYEEKSGAILVSKNTFKSGSNSDVGAGLIRKKAIEIIYKSLPKDTRFFATTGKTARELNEVNSLQKYHKCFFCIGGMGHVSSIALGYKISRPQEFVVCLDGDGSLLMHLGALASIGKHLPNRFIHIIFDNKVHESVGGQEIAFTQVDYLKLFQAFKYSQIYEVNSERKLEESIDQALQYGDLTAIIVKTKNYSEPGLSRPKDNPRVWKNHFIEHNL